MRSIMILVFLLVSCTFQVVEEGDTVSVTYTGRYENGTVFDTNDLKSRDIYPEAEDEKFVPLSVEIGDDQVIPGFEQALLEMRLGEEKTVLIKAGEAYGTYDKDKLITVPKYQVLERELTIQRERVMPLSEIQQIMTNITIGATYETSNFKYRIVDIADDLAKIYLMHSVRRPIQLPGMPWTSSRVDGNPERLIFEHNVTEGNIYKLSNGPYRAEVNETHILLISQLSQGVTIQGPFGVGRVISETGMEYTLDFNHPLAGYNLEFTIKVEEIE